MIIDNEANTLYLSHLTVSDYPDEIKSLKKIVIKNGGKVKILEETDDYWCRDYMHIQISEKDFIQFVYRPKRYIKPDDMEFISNPVKIELANKLTQPRYSRIVLDGGNIVKWKDKAIITDRVIDDNLFQFPDGKETIKQLEADLKCRVIIIPQYPDEKTGHADGLIRFIDDDTVLINTPEDEPEKEWLKKFLTILSQNQLLHIKLPCAIKPNQEDVTGLYINYLQLGNLIIMPTFGLKEDDIALQIMNEVFVHIPLKADTHSGNYRTLFSKKITV